ncbi:MAG: putative sensor protein [Candidatus Saccharibacteria bacterium]|nr:putative sensor protein [Candidatus Saccharibacteria bacterium]
MTPLRLSHTWHRRLYVAIFLLSFSLIAIYALKFAAVFSIPESFEVNLVTAVIAGLAAFTSAVFFFMEEKLSGFGYSMTAFTLLTLAVGWQVLHTGGLASPYFVFWTLIAFFAALFGAYGWLAITFLIGSYIAGVYLAHTYSFETFGLLFLGTALPLVIGILVWREQGEIDDSTKNVKNLANQLSEVASKSEIVINAIGDGVIAVDSTATIQLINPAAQQMLGWGKQDALKLSYKSILKLEDERGTDLDPALDPIEQVLNTNQQSRAKHLIALTKSGKKISVSLVVNPIGDTGSGAIIVFRDITKERAEEREQAEFISTASHEMRTPVAAIEGYLGLAMNATTATVDARAKDFIMKAHEAAQHLGRLFQDLLDVSKSDDGRLTNVPKVVDVVSLTETIIQGLNEKAVNKGLKLIFNSANTAAASSSQKKIMPVYYVNQDNDHIREILDNLIDNAIKYTPQGEVIVDVSGDEDKVIISVKDSGLGIPPEDIPHLFQKFYRVNNMDRQEIGGTGLGLYLVRRLTENMQGRIWVESVYQKGSTFFLQLPRIETQEAEHLKEQQGAKALQVAASTPVAAPAPIPASNAAPMPIPALTPAPAAMPMPVPPAPIVAPAAIPVPQELPVAPPAARPATSVPRGETLTREQINERVKQLEALSKQQRGQSGR